MNIELQFGLFNGRLDHRVGLIDARLTDKVKDLSPITILKDTPNIMDLSLFAQLGDESHKTLLVHLCRLSLLDLALLYKHKLFSNIWGDDLLIFVMTAIASTLCLTLTLKEVTE